MSSGDIYITMQADTGQLEADFARARAEVQALTRELNKNAAEARSTGQTADSELGQHINALGAQLSAAKGQFAQLNDELKAHKAAAEDAGGALARLNALGEQAKHALELAGVEIGFDAFKEWVASTAEAAEHIERLSHQLAASTDEVQLLQGVAKLTGTDFDQMAVQLERLQLRLAETATAANPARAALKALGIDADAFRKLSIWQQYERLAEAASHFADSATKTAVFQALGRGFVELLPMLDRGTTGFDELAEAVKRSGVVLSGDLVAKFTETQEQIKELSLAADGFGNRMFVVLRGPIDAAIQELTRLLEAANPQVLTGYLQGFATGLAGMGDSVAKFAIEAKKDWEELVSAITGSFGPIVTAAETVAGWLAEIENLQRRIADNVRHSATLAAAGGAGAPLTLDDLSGKGGPQAGGPFGGLPDRSSFDRRASDIEAQAAHDAKAISDSIKSAAARFNELVGFHLSEGVGGLAAAHRAAESTLGQVAPFQAGGRGAGAGRRRGAGNDEAEQARQSYQTQVEAAVNAARGTLDALDNEVRQHKISWDQWAKDSTAALEKEKQAIEAAANAAMKSASLTSIEKQRIANEEMRALAEIAKKEADDQAKAAEEAQRAWENAFKPINSTIESAIGSLVDGQKRVRDQMGRAEHFNLIGDSFKKMIDSMLVDLLKFSAQWALHVAEMVAQKLAGDQLIQASQQATDAGSAASSIAKYAAAIPAEISQVVAGVSAFMAPLVGPAAPAVGIAAGAAVQGVTHFDIGAWNLPEDQLGRLHKSELVMPAAEAGAFREMLSNAARGQGGSGGAGAVHIHPTVNLHHSSLDGESTAAFYRRTGPQMMRGIEEAVRHGAHLGLKGLRR